MLICRNIAKHAYYQAVPNNAAKHHNKWQDSAPLYSMCWVVLKLACASYCREHSHTCIQQLVQPYVHMYMHKCTCPT